MPARNQSFDGLRGVAVGAVLVYHHGLFNTGWFGVDLFFVLSGFLITSILRRTCEDPSYWKEFWLKRVTRLMPALFLFLAAAMLIEHFAARWALLCLASFGDVLAVYLHPVSEGTRPMWSLAVEEHFYFLWPLAVRFLSRRSLFRLLTAVILLEPLLRAALCLTFHPGWEVAYFLTPFRLDGISWGSLLALLVERKEAEQLFRRFSGSAILATLVLYGGLRVGLGVAFTRDGDTPVYNALIYSVMALFAFWVIAYLLTKPESIAARVLGFKPLVFLGTISYGVYLYEVVIRDLLMQLTGWSMSRVFWLSATMTVLVSWISFRWIEKPLILWGKRKAEALHHTFSGSSVTVTTAP